MGCLNSEGKFSRWFGNIHLSGPCNRSCYFCIGQHMMAVDSLNTLDTYPLPGIEKFVWECFSRGIETIYVTGTNTDPLLYRHTEKLVRALQKQFVVGVRTNGVQALSHPERWKMYDKASVTLCSFDADIYRRMMGSGEPPDFGRILELKPSMDVKVNIVLGPENTPYDVVATLDKLCEFGPRRVNLREPYGQPHVGNPFEAPDSGAEWLPNVLGMPHFKYRCLDVVYWDVHYVEVESVNLYANGHVSINYPITKGVAFDKGEVHDQKCLI